MTVTEEGLRMDLKPIIKLERLVSRFNFKNLGARPACSAKEKSCAVDQEPAAQFRIRSYRR